MKFNKIKRGVGVEWIIIFTALSMLFSAMICLNYYYIVKSEARKLAINISNSIVLDEKYAKKFSGINSKVDFDKIINNLNILYMQYADDFIKYVEKNSYFDNFNLVILKAEKICLLLNNNKFYTSGNNSELEEVKEGFKLFKNKKDMQKELYTFNFDIQNEKIKEKKSFFLPTFTEEAANKILNNDLVNVEENFFEKFNNEDRKVINETKTKEIIEDLVNNYNKSIRKPGFSGFIIRFDDYNKETKFNENNISFFFYSYSKEHSSGDLNIKNLDNLSYKIRSFGSNNFKNGKNSFFYYYPNSLHLVICCNIYIPFIGLFELKYPLDIYVEQKDLQ